MQACDCMSAPTRFVYMSTQACVPVHVCLFVCMSTQYIGLFGVCVREYVKEKFACPCLSEWLGLSWQPTLVMAK